MIEFLLCIKACVLLLAITFSLIYYTHIKSSLDFQQYQMMLCYHKSTNNHSCKQKLKTKLRPLLPKEASIQVKLLKQKSYSQEQIHSWVSIRFSIAKLISNLSLDHYDSVAIPTFYRRYNEE